MASNSLRRWHAQSSAVQRAFSQDLFRGTRIALIKHDCRVALEKLPNESVDCVITSPPYGPLKNYGHKKQLGFGQHFAKEYLPDLEKVVSQLYRIARNGAAFWLIADTVRVNGQSIALPWEIAQRAQHAGWLLQDIAIWDKG